MGPPKNFSYISLQKMPSFIPVSSILGKDAFKNA